ncbi:MAG: hypothetical protein GY754_45935 [bacterium]|nr:hypothetical protein [bacterium]
MEIERAGINLGLRFRIEKTGVPVFTLTDEIITFDQAIVLKEVPEGFLGGVVVNLGKVKQKDQVLDVALKEIREKQENAGRYLRVVND